MKIMRCPKCGAYTLKMKCGKCGTAAATAHPPRFSLEKEKKYGKYRRAQGKALNEKKAIMN